MTPADDVDHCDDPGDGVLTEVPQPPYVTGEDVRFAVLAIVRHAPLPTPSGPVCRHDRRAYPCRLHRWGRRVLDRCGLRPTEIDALVARGDPAAVPPATAWPTAAGADWVRAPERAVVTSRSPLRIDAGHDGGDRLGGAIR